MSEQLPRSELKPRRFMVRGRDYTVDESGLYVFTREYLLRRGYCCLSGCRNCPWGHTGRTSPLGAPEPVDDKAPQS